MASVQVNPGICGLESSVEAILGDDGMCAVKGESACPHVRELLTALGPVDPFGEISYRMGMPRVLATAQETLPHPACPVPCALLKAIEVASGLALPADVSVVVSD